MTADELLAAASDAFGTATIDVRPAQWVATAITLRDEAAFGYFDWLSAYDDGEAGLAVVVRAWSVTRRVGILVRTRVPREGGVLATLIGVWAGAAWHERETREMFGIEFGGHDDLRPLLLPDGFDGHPLRKEFVLASRVAKEWPGAKEPGESTPGRKRPLGVPR